MPHIPSSVRIIFSGTSSHSLAIPQHILTKHSLNKYIDSLIALPPNVHESIVSMMSCLCRRFTSREMARNHCPNSDEYTIEENLKF